MPTIARYSLDGPVLPLVQATLPLAEAARRALMSRYRKLKEIERYGRPDPPNAERFASPVFSGKDERGTPAPRRSWPCVLSADGRRRRRPARSSDRLRPRRLSARRGARPRCTAVAPVRRSGTVAAFGRAGTSRPSSGTPGFSGCPPCGLGDPVPGHAAHEAPRAESATRANFSRRPRAGSSSSNKSCARSYAAGCTEVRRERGIRAVGLFCSRVLLRLSLSRAASRSRRSSQLGPASPSADRVLSAASAQARRRRREPPAWALSATVPRASVGPDRPGALVPFWPGAVPARKVGWAPPTAADPV